MNHMFFDLEGVLIDSWFNPEILTDLKPIIGQMDCIDLFTFAIYNKEDMDLFNTSIRPKIESFFGRKVNIVQSREIIVMNPNIDDEHDLIKDMIAIVTSFCCRLYGMRRAKNKMERLEKILKENNEE